MHFSDQTLRLPKILCHIKIKSLKVRKITLLDIHEQVVLPLIWWGKPPIPPSTCPCCLNRHCEQFPNLLELVFGEQDKQASEKN